MRTTGAFIAELLDDLQSRALVGANLLDLEHRARHLIEERGALSCYWDYAPSFGRGPFHNVICLSVNDAVLHGLPHDYTLRDGDLLSMDIAVSIDGWVADSARSLIVGTPRADDQRLIEATERIRRARTRSNDARGPARVQPGAGRTGPGAATRIDPRTRALVRPRNRQDRLRPRRVDHPIGRRLADRPQRTHDCNHRR